MLVQNIVTCLTQSSIYLSVLTKSGRATIKIIDTYYL